jgi:hypothetical protein
VGVLILAAAIVIVILCVCVCVVVLLVPAGRDHSNIEGELRHTWATIHFKDNGPIAALLIVFAAVIAGLCIILSLAR